MAIRPQLFPLFRGRPAENGHRAESPRGGGVSFPCPGLCRQGHAIGVGHPLRPVSRENVRLLGVIDERLQAMAADAASPWHGPPSTWWAQRPESATWRRSTRATAADRRADIDAVLAVLVVVLRRPLVSLYLVLTVLLGFSVSMGVTKLVFSWLDGAGVCRPGLEAAAVPVRHPGGGRGGLQHLPRHPRGRGTAPPGALEGLRVAVVRTGGIITSCGVIMAGTFASMMTGTLPRRMQELGFSLAFGVLLDTS